MHHHHWEQKATRLRTTISSTMSYLNGKLRYALLPWDVFLLSPWAMNKQFVMHKICWLLTATNTKQYVPLQNKKLGQKANSRGWLQQNFFWHQGIYVAFCSISNVYRQSITVDAFQTHNRQGHYWTLQVIRKACWACNRFVPIPFL